MKVTKNVKDTTMKPTNAEEEVFCEQLLQGGDVAVVKVMQDQNGLYLEFTPLREEDIED
jgi:hypothetical protein